jgi:predicted O-methyltransferase YrrM
MKNLKDFTYVPSFDSKIENRTGEYMTDDEYDFIRQLVGFAEPKNVLEIGVARGRGSVNLLRAMNKAASLTSIDTLDRIVLPDGETSAVGQLVRDAFPDIKAGRFRLVTKKDPFEVMDSPGKSFDFCVIDSGHFHPVETLNFLAALPYLEDGALVVLHDLSNYMHRAYNKMDSQFATRLLFASVVADKYIPVIPDRGGVENIGVLQVTADTRKYVANLFEMLKFPWYVLYLPNNMRAYIAAHYGETMTSVLDKAIAVNKVLAVNKAVVNNILEWVNNFRNVIFYGAGANMASIRFVFGILGRDFHYAIWDIAAEKIGKAGGCDVAYPDFVTPAKSGDVMIVTISDEDIYQSVRERFEPLGYTVVHGLR